MAKLQIRRIRQSQPNGEKIWRRSRLAGHCESMFWQPFNKEDGKRFLYGAELFERHTRKPGRPAGALGHVGIEVLRELIRAVDWKTGRLDPSITTLMARLKRSKAAVVEALRRLRAAGFLDWIRRYVPTGRDGFGPQVQQTSNAYRLSLPKAAAKLLGLLAKAPPVAADLAAGSAERARLQKVYALADIPLGGALDRLEALINQRESTRRNESPSGSLFNVAEDKTSGAAATRRPV